MKRTVSIILLFIFHSFTFHCFAEDRGFIHPGGLHTQADFDRVKAQIAAKNPTVLKAWTKLRNAEYAQASVQTSPTETIVRGGSGENYINAARGATMAYQNALRWKIGGTVANAKAAVRILMAWANTTTAISGTSDACLAYGLYGYQFAQAAELMRDYEGWKREDFEKFQQWMLTVWYPGAIGFLRVRNGTWENSGKWWQAPGHYWSNWGLCNALCVMSIGILCDNVQIYNEGISFIKYDQVGNFTDPPTTHEVTGHSDYTGLGAIQNDGLTDFWGNLIVTDVESELETGAYGHIGQLNESGRDAGHCAMSLGLAVDIAKIAWNQGDDLFAYMSHRLAAGIEYVAAQTQSVQGLPWTDYIYGTNGYYYSDSRAWVMTEPALGAQMRPYWGTVIGIYEGVKGVRMPFSELAYQQMGIDGGGSGSTSGGYDHLGYSVLMNTRDEQLCPADQVPTELTGQMEYSNTLTATFIPSLVQERKRGLVSGKVTNHTELGGLVNNYNTTKSALLPDGKTLRLIPILPEGEEDTGLWQWNTGETTREITVETGWSYIYRVTYTNKNGIKSQLAFSIATTDKGEPVGIEKVKNERVKSEKWADAVYDLQGRRVGSSSSALPKGVYIMNARMVAIR
ncbi:MAG: alginate lyase family protein [Bacteroidaceae bacterium]|nr:alginate lyase family protein [Bacteroidaceae bacterium]